MASATIEVSGSDAERRAQELQTALRAAPGPGGSVTEVEVARSAELIVAVIGLVFCGVDAAKTIWDWWHPQRAEPVTVKVILDDGAQIDLSTMSREQLEAELARRVADQGQGTIGE